MSKSTVHARIQLKNDTEKNWSKSHFTPLPGELIIYSSDDAHPFFRIKVGDGRTVVTELPFITTDYLHGLAHLVQGSTAYTTDITDNSQAIATTAFVQNVVANALKEMNTL